jgi:serine/threonine-protein kinase
MSLDPGTILGPYEILTRIGAGGMGEVFRAKDTRLGRDVAIKVLPEAFSENKERLARFEREARLLASLNHPNIAAIHELEEFDGVHFLALEYVPGETLAERIKRGAIPVDEVLLLFKQIAEGLEAAHEKGVIHRDLKPANIKVTPEGKVKVLDFGLAKARERDSSSQGLSESPTLTKDFTETGVLLGTAPYMSPEQARGKAVDKRTDVWAFGCCLYEALTGKAAFLGETVSDTIAGILKQEPDWKALPVETPPLVRSLLRRTLVKDANHRLQHIGDARVEIEEALSEPAAAEMMPMRKQRASSPKQVGLLGVILGAAVASVVAWYLVGSTRIPAQEISRFSINLPTESVLGGRPSSIAISPDGRRLVFSAITGDGKQLYLRTRDQFEALPIPGTEGGELPFFSPDSQWVGFFAEGKLKKVSLAGGAPVTLCDTDARYGGSWGSEDTIVFAASRAPYLRIVSAGGGTPEPIPDLPTQQGETHYYSPAFLPDGKSILFGIFTGAGIENQRVGIHTLGTSGRRILIDGGGSARYASTGHLIYVRANSLMAAPFDIDQLEVTGPQTPVVQGMSSEPVTQSASDFSLSSDGSLAYAPSQGALEITVHWMDRQGDSEIIPLPPRQYMAPSLSPDGRRLAVTTIDGPHMETWVYDLERHVLTRFTFEGSNHFNVWTPDGRRLAFSSDREGPHNIFWKATDGSGAAERLAFSDGHQDIGSWSPDGKILSFSEARPETKLDIWLLYVEEPRRAESFLQTEFDEEHPMISPDGRWIAYTSNESGRSEVYVQPFPNGGRKWQISTDGGSGPRWARNGQELFYHKGPRMMVVAVETAADFIAGRPEFLFEVDGLYDVGQGGPNYDITPDGKRFVFTQPKPQPRATQINVVQNWFAELKRLVPTN